MITDNKNRKTDIFLALRRIKVKTKNCQGTLIPTLEMGLTNKIGYCQEIGYITSIHATKFP